jgi:hypothetical protein
VSRRTFRPKPEPLKLGEVLPVACDAHIIQRVFHISLGSVYDWHRDGKLRRFELRKPMGSKRWSGRLLQAFLDGEGHLSSAQLPRRFAESA